MVWNDELIHHNLAQKLSVFIVSDDKCIYDNLEQLPSTYTLYNDNFTRYALDGC